MVIWVKELSGKLTVGRIRIWIKDYIPVKRIDFSSVCDKDYVFVSKDDRTIDNEIQIGKILVYEELFNVFFPRILQEINYNYDYYFLKNALNKAKNESVDTIITGSSYGLFAINGKELSGAVNLSLPSQDLYYAYAGIKDVCLVNRNIKNIVLCCSYYYFFCDLSKSKSDDELSRISKVYYPMFYDMHNAMYLLPKINLLFVSEIFDFERITDLYSLAEYERTYFNEDRPRYGFAIKLWNDKSKRWAQLTKEEKSEAGKNRALTHNKVGRYWKTLSDNQEIFMQLVNFCLDNKINLIILVTPISKYYRVASLELFKDVFYNNLNNADGIIHLIDLYADESFSDDDYNDMDHLSENGANKVTSILNEAIKQINN